MKKTPGILKSSAFLMCSRILSSICTFFLFWLISQKSVQALGAFRTIFVFFLITEFLPLLGTNQLVIREISTSRTSLNKFFLHSLFFSIIVSLLICLFLIGLGTCGNYSSTISKGIIILAFGLPATATVLCSQSVLIGLGRGDLFGLIQGFENFLRTTVGALLIYLGYSILSVVVCFVVNRWLILIIYWMFLRPYFKQNKWYFDFSFLKSFLKEVPTFLGILISYMAIRFSPQVLLPWIKNDTAAGFFAVPYQFIDIILLAPTAFSINLMPLFAQNFKISTNALLQSCNNALKMISTIIIPVVLMFFLMARPVILHIFGQQYMPSIPILKIIIWVGLFFSIDQVLSMVTIASKNQFYDLLTLASGGLATTTFLFILIELMGAIGAAIGYLLGITVLIIVRIIFIKKILQDLKLFSELWRPVFAAVPVLITVQFLKYNCLISSITGLVLYVFFLILTGCFNRRELLAMKSLLNSRV